MSLKALLIKNGAFFSCLNEDSSFSLEVAQECYKLEIEQRNYDIYIAAIQPLAFSGKFMSYKDFIKSGEQKTKNNLSSYEIMKQTRQIMKDWR